MPLPPPPPPGPPPPPTFVPANQSSAECRNVLLQSIRQGTSLKKTITNDKSAPVIQGAVRPSSNNSGSGGSTRGNVGINGSATLGRNNGLAGLFSQGMPKLKPTGLDIGQNNSQSLTSLPSAMTSVKQEQTRRQFNVDIKNRGPPPKPPPANLKPTMPQDNILVDMRTKFFSSEKLWAPSPTQSQLGAPSTPKLSCKYVGLRSPIENRPTDNYLKNSHLLPSSLNKLEVFKFPFPTEESVDASITFPGRMSSANNFSRAVTLSDKSIKRRKFIQSGNISSNHLQIPLENRHEYNKYRNSSTIHPLIPLTTNLKCATSPLHNRSLKLSDLYEFKIQRPKLSLADANLEQPSMVKSTSDSVLTGPLHNRSNSTTSLNSNNSWTQQLPKAPPGGYGKPNVAPKPPGIAAKSPGKLLNGRTSVTRAQSMRTPRSPPVAPPQSQIPLLPNHTELHRGAPVFHQSQDSILHTPPPPKHHTLPSPRAAPPSRPPLRPPQTRPPPPPPNRVVMSSPPCPPPPPPTQAPPPPPHRVPLQNHKSPVTPMVLSTGPPPPPARHSSIRNGIPQAFSSKLEARFIEKFNMKEKFPPPQTFLGVAKVYNSKTAKQPAPQPPQHIQLPWSRDNSSVC